MKEETKNGLRKFGKVVGYGLGLFAMLLLGVGLGNCSAKDKPVKANAETGLVLADHKQALNPKRALDPAEWHTLSPDADNLLLDAEGGHNDLVHNSELAGFRLPANNFRDTYLLPLAVGSYVIEYSAHDNDWRGRSMLINEYGAVEVRKAFSGEPTERVLLEDNDIKSGSDISFVGGYLRSVFDVTAPYTYLLVMCGNSSTYGVKLSVWDWESAPASRVITFPDDYNPLSGFGIPNDGLIGQLSGNHSSPFRLDLSFRSGGQLFKRVDFYFLPMQGLEYVSALNSSGSPSVFSGSGFVYCSVIEYISESGASFTAWRSIFGTKADGNVYFRNFGEWSSKQYQTIEVISYTPVYGQSGVAPNLDQVGILELRTSSGVPTPIIGGNGNADVFSLLGVGFQSVAGLLNIQILPFLTLGTLIFVPLVVIVIFAILKVLNK